MRKCVFFSLCPRFSVTVLFNLATTLLPQSIFLFFFNYDVLHLAIPVFQQKFTYLNIYIFSCFCINYIQEQKRSGDFCRLFKNHVFTLIGGYFTIVWWFWHVSPHIETPSHFIAHPIPLGLSRAPALNALLLASNLHWSSILHMLICFSGTLLIFWWANNLAIWTLVSLAFQNPAWTSRSTWFTWFGEFWALFC